MLYVILIAVAMLLAASWAMLPAAFLLGVATGHRKRIKLERENVFLHRTATDLRGALIDATCRLNVQNSDKFQNPDTSLPIESVGTQVENPSDWFSRNTVIDSD